ncbi:MAG: uroporphyrinogen-III decarboxylase-like protein [Planctomycetes bacterium]|nr:uroporphyrinogen-III decarboxylase-like protein [Planctomycetota bacterium]
MSDRFRHLAKHPIRPDWPALRANLERRGAPERVHFIELLVDDEVKAELVRRFDLGPFEHSVEGWFRREIALLPILGQEILRPRTKMIFEFPRPLRGARDSTSAAGQSRGERKWTDEHTGPIAGWPEFEAYPWPDPEASHAPALEWLSRELPDGFVIAGSCHQIFEQTSWLMGLENLCYKLEDDPDLVAAVFERVGAIHYEVAKIFCACPRVELLFGGDDMGFRGGTLIPPDLLRAHALPWHKKISDLAHATGRLNILHSCGNVEAIMPDLIDVVGIDGKHSFEDVIEPVTVAKHRWGDRIAVLGGIDVDFLARAGEAAVRRRVRETLDECLPGGGYCLGSGNSIANYIPVENYLAMIDEGRRYL